VTLVDPSGTGVWERIASLDNRYRKPSPVRSMVRSQRSASCVPDHEGERGTTADAEGCTTRRSYDHSSPQTTLTDAGGRITTLAYWWTRRVGSFASGRRAPVDPPDFVAQLISRWVQPLRDRPRVGTHLLPCEATGSGVGVGVRTRLPPQQSMRCR
jgi:hypothetical protein